MKHTVLADRQRHAGSYSHCRDLEVEYEGYGGAVDLRAPDISPRGMFINTARAFPEGAVLKLHFRLGRSSQMIFARGEVRYCLPGVGVGVEFVDISEDAKEAIREAACDQFEDV